jgi:hypothetical protein
VIQRETKVNCQYKLLSRCFPLNVEERALRAREKEEEREREKDGEEGRKERLA